ncbi:AAA family ATPase [Microbacteriaceae bacterium]|nr:AAA family ATPase [Candidatus Saccharibacteria bacterium]
MKILQLRIINFRQFKDITIDFPELTTSIVGMNGSGKTTLIDAINILMSQFNPESKISVDDFHDSDKPIKLAAVFDEYYFIEIEDGWTKRTLPSKMVALEIDHRSASGQKVFNSPYTSKYSMVPTVYASSATQVIPTEFAQTTPSKVYKYDEAYRFIRANGEEGSVGPLQLSSINHAVGFPATFYYGSDREKELKHGFSTLWSKLTEELDWRYFKKFLEADDEIRIAFRDGVKSTKERVDATTTGSRRKDIVKELVKQSQTLLGEKYKDLEISYLNPQRPHKKSELALHWPDKIISLDKLGSGERAILAFLLSVIVAKHSKNPIILLVDEMETHLHPQLMTGLRDYLEKEDVQIIYTTHSENLIDLGKWKSVKRLSSGKIYPEEVTLYTEIESKTLRQHLDDISLYYLDKTVLKKEDAQLLFGDKALLVEGPKDKFCIPVASTKMSNDISDIPTILACNGKTKIPHYQVLCAAFGVNYFVIFDKDDETKESEQAKNNRITSFAAKSYGFEPSFESVMGRSSMAGIIDAIEADNIPQQVIDCVHDVYQWKDA